MKKIYIALILGMFLLFGNVSAIQNLGGGEYSLTISEFGALDNSTIENYIKQSFSRGEITWDKDNVYISYNMYDISYFNDVEEYIVNNNPYVSEFSYTDLMLCLSLTYTLNCKSILITGNNPQTFGGRTIYSTKKQAMMEAENRFNRIIEERDSINKLNSIRSFLEGINLI